MTRFRSWARRSKGWRIVLVLLLVAAPLAWESVSDAPPAAAEAAPVMGDGYCTGPHLALVVGTCSDEAAGFLWSIKDPAFWHMAYVGLLELNGPGELLGAGVWTDGEYGCSYPSGDIYGSTSHATRMASTNEAFETYQECVVRVEEEAERQYLIRAAFGQVGPGGDLSELTDEELEILCGAMPFWSECNLGAGAEAEGFAEWAEALPPGASFMQGTGMILPTPVNDPQSIMVLIQPNDAMTLGTWYPVLRAAGIETREEEAAHGQARAVWIDWRITGTVAGEPTGIQTRRIYCASAFNCGAGIISETDTMTHAWRGEDAYYGVGINMPADGSHGTIRDATVDMGPGAFLSDDLLVGSPSSMFDLFGWDVGDDMGEDTILVRWENPVGATGLQTALDGLEDVFPGELPPEWAPTFPSEVPAPEAPPAVPTPIEIPEPEPVPGEDPGGLVTPAEGEQGWFDILGNRIAGFFDSLASGIGAAFGWLGQHLLIVIQWLIDALWSMFTWLAEYLRQLFHWLGNMLSNALGALGALLASLLRMVVGLLQWIGGLLGAVASSVVDIVSQIVALPGLIVDAIGSLLHDLFVPENVTALEWECAEVWPCNWLQEGVDFTTGVAAIATGGGGCTAPGIGWDEFTVSVPPPSGCSAATGAVAADSGNAGDLFGYRVAVRAAAFALFGIWLVTLVLASTPWARHRHLRFHGEQQTLFDGFD